MSSKICNCRTSKFTVLDFERNKDLVFTEPVSECKESKVSDPETKTAVLSQESCDVEALILSTLARDGNFTLSYTSMRLNWFKGVIEDSWDLACRNGIDHQVIIGTMKSLLADAYVNDIVKSVEIWLLTGEGQDVMTMGSPEFQVIQ